MDNKGTDEKSKKDLAILPRAQLIKGGFEALAKNSVKDAQYYFGAAIRKAKRVQLWDVEAEFYKFVSLYIHGNYHEAAKRCVECLDAVKMISDVAKGKGVLLNVDLIESKLTDALIQTMVLRRDTFWQMTGHFWQRSKGEFYLLKKTHSLPEAMMKAWFSFSTRIKISYDMLKNEVRPYTGFLQEQLDAAADMIKKGENEAEADKDATVKRETKKGPSLVEIEAEYTSKLKKYAELTLMRLSNTDVEELYRICKATKNPVNLGEIAKLTDMLGPNSKKPYYAALEENELIRDREKKLPDANAERLRQEVLEFVDRRDGRSV